MSEDYFWWTSRRNKKESRDYRLTLLHGKKKGNLKCVDCEYYAYVEHSRYCKNCSWLHKLQDKFKELKARNGGT